MADASILPPEPSPEDTATNPAPSALRGWAELRRAVNLTLPNELDAAAAVRARALSLLGVAR